MMSDIRFRDEDEKRAWWQAYLVLLDNTNTDVARDGADRSIENVRKREQPEDRTDAVLLAEEAAHRNADECGNESALRNIHIICADSGIAPGHVTERVRAMAEDLREARDELAIHRGIEQEEGKTDAPDLLRRLEASEQGREHAAHVLRNIQAICDGAGIDQSGGTDDRVRAMADELTRLRKSDQWGQFTTIHKTCDLADVGSSNQMACVRVKMLADELKEERDKAMRLLADNQRLERDRNKFADSLPDAGAEVSTLEQELKEANYSATKALKAAVAHKDDRDRWRTKVIDLCEGVVEARRELARVTKENEGYREDLDNFNRLVEQLNEELARLKAERGEVLAEKVTKVWATDPTLIPNGNYASDQIISTQQPYTRTVTVTAGHGEKGGESNG